MQSPNFDWPNASRTAVLGAVVFVCSVSESHSSCCLSEGKRHNALLHLQIENVVAVICSFCVFISIMSKVCGVFLIIIKAAEEIQGLRDHFISLCVEM